MALTSHTQEPATSSRASAKGPSITVRLAPSKAILLPADEGFSPSPSIITPAFTNSSLNAPIASNISVISAVGGRPFSLSSVAFTNTITRIGHLLRFGADMASCVDDERAIAKSTGARFSPRPAFDEPPTGQPPPAPYIETKESHQPNPAIH